MLTRTSQAASPPILSLAGAAEVGVLEFSKSQPDNNSWLVKRAPRLACWEAFGGVRSFVSSHCAGKCAKTAIQDFVSSGAV